jgi:quercetin dioxygenase-like cupin family protein
MVTHIDSRRKLESWPEAKVITAIADCTLGNHYHKVKTEKFVVISGNVVIDVGGRLHEVMEVGKIYCVFPNERHSFSMQEGAEMIGLCSHPFDHNDDYKY